MRWITGITLDNYRAFPLLNPSDPTPSTKVNFGKHLLIYGENGSGKSSIFNALSDFFVSSDSRPQIEYSNNIFEQSADGKVGIEITDDTGSVSHYHFSNPDTQSNHKVDAIRQPNKIKGFLDYKRLLRINSFDKTFTGRPNIFKVLVKDILGNHLITNPKSGALRVPLYKTYSTLTKDLLSNNSSTNKYQNQKDIELPRLNNSLKELFRNLQLKINEMLEKYFSTKLQIEFLYREINVRINGRGVPRSYNEGVELKVEYAGKEIENYPAFLNEARLSALAICTYLSSIMTYPIGATDLRVLFLDDVFIGLDTSNRIPLLEMLRDKFIKDDFQVFIATYDRQWFELASTWFRSEKIDIQRFEMYADTNGNDPTKPDLPDIKPSDNDYLGKAMTHFKQKDYPAAANYLRKSCEAELKRILPQNFKLRTDRSKGTITEINTLQQLFDKFKKYADRNAIDFNPFRHFETYKKILLNPLSHDDLDSPHYRVEIENGFLVVGLFKTIETKLVLKVDETTNSTLELEIDDLDTKETHDYEISIIENLYIIKENDNPIRFSVVECKLKEINGQERKYSSLHKAIDKIWEERGYLGNADYFEFYKNIKVSSSIRLIDLMSY